MGQDQGPAWVWTRRQRVTLACLVLAACAWLTVLTFLHSDRVTDPQPPEGSRAAEIAIRLDPNHADWQKLSVLPQMGEKRAKEIVAYREATKLERPDRPVFARLEDLEPVKGIGKSTLAALAPYLCFPDADDDDADR